MRCLRIFLVFCLPLSLYGQGCCSGGPPLSGSLGLELIQGRHWQIESIFDYNTQQALILCMESVADNPRNRWAYAGLLRVSYAFNACLCLLRFELSGHNRKKGSGGGGGCQSINYAQGLGDAVILGS